MRGIKRNFVVTLALTLFCISKVIAGADPLCIDRPVYGVYSEKTKFLFHWKKTLKNLLDSLPHLSPREESDLMNKLKSSRIEESYGAMRSVENAIWQVRNDTVLLLGSIENLLKSSPGNRRMGLGKNDWAWLAASLISITAPEYTLKLIRQDLLSLNDIPKEWVGSNNSLSASDLHDKRLILAEHVLVCLLIREGSSN